MTLLVSGCGQLCRPETKVYFDHGAKLDLEVVAPPRERSWLRHGDIVEALQQAADLHLAVRVTPQVGGERGFSHRFALRIGADPWGTGVAARVEEENDPDARGTYLPTGDGEIVVELTTSGAVPPTVSAMMQRQRYVVPYHYEPRADGTIVFSVVPRAGQSTHELPVQRFPDEVARDIAVSLGASDLELHIKLSSERRVEHLRCY